MASLDFVSIIIMLIVLKIMQIQTPKSAFEQSTSNFCTVVTSYVGFVIIDLDEASLSMQYWVKMSHIYARTHIKGTH